MLSQFHRQGLHRGQRAESETIALKAGGFKMILPTHVFSLLFQPAVSLMSQLLAAPLLTRSGSFVSTSGCICVGYSSCCVPGSSFLFHPSELLRPWYECFSLGVSRERRWSEIFSNLIDIFLTLVIKIY